MNSMPKFVASTTLDDLEWNNSTLLEGDVAEAVGKLKRQEGGPILVAGSFFAALQVGGLAMQRSAGVSWQLAQVLQAIVILTLAMRVVPGMRRRGSSEPTPDLEADVIGQIAPGAADVVKV